MNRKSTSTVTPESKQLARVLIVDDHPVFRAGLAGLVNLENGLKVCGEVADATACMTHVETLQPDLLLLDMSLPGKSGLELIKDLRAIHPALRILVISMHDETLYAERVIRAGARGYIMKQEGPDKVIAAIRKVLAGGIAVSERGAGLILSGLSSHEKEARGGLSQLTDREFEVFRLIGSGREPQEIARILHLSIKTVDTHRAHIRQKLELKNGTELIHHATRWMAEKSGIGDI